MSPAFIAGCCALVVGLLMALSLPLACHYMRKHTKRYDPPVIRKVQGRTILGAEHTPTYATLTPLDEPNSWRLDIATPIGKSYRFFIGPEDDIKPIKKENSDGSHSAPWQSHDEHHKNFGTSIGVLPGTKLEMVLLYEDASGTPTQVDLLFMFGSQIRISFKLA